ncbi:unnamed protein product, partial [Linum tenue]
TAPFPPPQPHRAPPQSARRTKSKPRAFSIRSSAEAPTSPSPASSSSGALQATEIKERCLKWRWKGQYTINYFVAQSPSRSPPLLLVHGFGASIPYWRRNIETLAQNRAVYAIDLLGFGESDKPEGFSYTMETWAELIRDFLDEVVQKPTV